MDCDQTKNTLVLGTFNQQDSAVLAYLAVSCVPSEYEVYLHCSSPAAFLRSLHGCCEQVYPCTLDIANTAATQVRPEPDVRSVTTLRPTLTFLPKPTTLQQNPNGADARRAAKQSTPAGLQGKSSLIACCLPPTKLEEARILE